MSEKEEANNPDFSKKSRADSDVWSTANRPPLYNFIYLLVVSLCIVIITWIFRSGALQLWDRHPVPGEKYEQGWFISLLFAIPGGFVSGSLLMFYYLQWYWNRSSKTQKDDGTSS